MRTDVDDGKYWIEVFRSVLNRKSVPLSVKKPFQKGSSLGLGTHWYSYVACFSPESALEYQWEHYAGHGKGCAIEFSFQVLRDRCDAGESYAWTPMIYDENEQVIKAEKTVDAAITLYRSGNMTAEEARDYWADAAFSFLLCGTRFKRPCFHREKEWRIFVSRPDLDGVNFRGVERIRYLTLPLTAGMVTGLIKGPACTCPESELTELLSSAGYSTNISNAEPAAGLQDSGVDHEKPQGEDAATEWPKKPLQGTRGSETVEQVIKARHIRNYLICPLLLRAPTSSPRSFEEIFFSHVTSLTESCSFTTSSSTQGSPTAKGRPKIRTALCREDHELLRNEDAYSVSVAGARQSEPARIEFAIVVGFVLHFFQSAMGYGGDCAQMMEN